jgi:hypothetical protein
MPRLGLHLTQISLYRIVPQRQYIGFIVRYLLTAYVHLKLNKYMLVDNELIQQRLYSIVI